MIYFINFLKKINFFIICFFIFEKKTIRINIEKISYFLKYISITKYVLFKINPNKFNPIKSNAFNKFIKIGNFNLKNCKIKKNIKKVMLIENFINHPIYTYTNLVCALLINKIYNYNLIGILRKGDIKAEVLFRKFKIKKFIFIKEPNFFERLFYIYKAISLINPKMKIEDFCKLKYNKIDVGLSSYDTYIRYTKVPTLKEVDAEILVILASCLHKIDFFKKKKFFNKNIKKSIQSETVFNPLNSYFQLSLINKIEVYSRCLQEEISIRKYTAWNQRYLYRYNISQKMFDYVYKNEKNSKNKVIYKYFKKGLENKSFGIDPTITYLVKKNKKTYNKKEILNIFKWKNKPIVCFFPNLLIDRNFHNGPRTNFKDNYTWTKFLLNKIPELRNVNWIIKLHPDEKSYKAKENFLNEIRFLVKKYDHIKLFPKNINNISLIKCVDVAITSHGTAGIEYPAFGINSIYVDNSTYSNLNFIKMLKNKKEIISTLNKIHKLKPLNKSNILKCQTYLYIQQVLLKSKCSLFPKDDISRKINEEGFWNKCNYNLKKFDLKKDVFFRMLNLQIKYNMRHTLNTDKLKIKSLNLNDYSD